MTESEAHDLLSNVLVSLGVSSNDVIMLGIDMSAVALPSQRIELTPSSIKERELMWCGFVLNILRDSIAPNGTLLVPTFTYSHGLSLAPFYLESTPSEVNRFSEYVRLVPDSHRSSHPIFSLSGIGGKAEEILMETGQSAFGERSPWSRFGKFEVKFLTLGVELRRTITYGHHLEQMYGCPHRFNKTFSIPVFSNQKLQSDQWIAYVQSAGAGYSSDFSSLQDALCAQGKLRSFECRGNHNHLALVSDVNEVGLDLLMKNPLAFVKENIDLSNG